jgi:hypothetical protein
MISLKRRYYFEELEVDGRTLLKCLRKISYELELSAQDCVIL